MGSKLRNDQKKAWRAPKLLRMNAELAQSAFSAPGDGPVGQKS